MARVALCARLGCVDRPAQHAALGTCAGTGFARRPLATPIPLRPPERPHAAQAKARWAPKVGRRIPLGSQRARPVGGPSQMVERRSAANLARRLAESHGPVPRFDCGSGGLSVIRSSLDASRDLVALSHPRQSTTSRGRSHQGNSLGCRRHQTGLGGCRKGRVELVILPEGSPSPRQSATRALLCGRRAGWPCLLQHQGLAEC